MAPAYTWVGVGASPVHSAGVLRHRTGWRADTHCNLRLRSANTCSPSDVLPVPRPRLIAVRIAQVVTFLSADGSYGGPVSVAVGQCTELARRGHDVTLLAGWDGSATTPPGFGSRLFRVRQLLPGGTFSTLVSLTLVVHLIRHVREWDVVHVHLARDLVVVPAALVCLWRGIPLVVQTHGAMAPDRGVKYRVFDRLAICRILRDARAQLVLTELERAQALAVEPGRDNISTLPNGVGATSIRAHASGTRPPQVIFCARLHPRKRVLVFADMAELLLRRGVRATFPVLGSDEGDLPALLRRIDEPALRGALTYEGTLAPAAVLARLAEGQVLVLPSFDEPFPMTVLEAWSAGLPVVITRSNGLAATLEKVDGALVVDGSATSLADAVQGLLVSGGARWSDSAESAVALAGEVFAVAPVVNSLESIYAGCSTRHGTISGSAVRRSPVAGPR